MKWLVVSDNHGGWAKLNEIFDHYREEVQLIIHCGDSEFPADDPIWEKVDIVVSGNMDFDPQYFQSRTLETEFGKILVVHGHRNGVNAGNKELFEEAKKLNAKFVFHGHTHRLYAEYTEGILLLNPGSLNHSRGPIDERTFALLEIGDEFINVKFFNDDLNELSDLSHKFER